MSWVAWWNAEVVCLSKMITHPSTNQARCTVTSLICPMPSPLKVPPHLKHVSSLPCKMFGTLLKKLQAVQNATPQIVTAAKKFNHITPVLCDLHLLPVRQRIKCKLAMTVYKCLRGLAPTYLADNCLAISAIAGKRHLRSARTGMLSVPRTTTTLGMRIFAVVGPIISSLPAALRTATLSPLTFARHLKAHLFG